MIELRRPPGQLARVGHRGAPALAPENTLRSLELAVEHGCDTVEFDVLSLRGGRVVVAHSRRELPADVMTLERALEACAERFPGIGLQLDVKRRGIEKHVVTLLAAYGVRERAWISSFSSAILRRFAQLDPDLPRSYTLPRDRAGLSRALLQRRVPVLLRRAKASSLTLHHSLVSPLAVERAHELGAAVYAWTVNDIELAKALLGAGVDGIITDDPRIFSDLTT